MPTKKQATISDVLSAFNVFADDQEKRMQRIEGDISEIKSDISIIKRRVGGLESDVGSLRSEFTSIKKEVIHIQNHMVTKEYLDRKLSDVHDSWKIILNRVDERINALIQVLVAKQIVNERDVSHILAMKITDARKKV